MSCLRRCLWPTLCVMSVAAAETVAKVLRVAKKCGLKHVSPTTPGIDLIIEVGADCREVEVDLADRDLSSSSMKVVGSLLKHNSVRWRCGRAAARHF